MNTNTDASQNNRNNPDAVLRHKIEERAYHIWLESGGGHGDHERHWLQAEKELTNATNKGERQSGAREGKKAAKPH
ncbi:MAG TPA: DUF2934 domain-containing protein [Candidatus Acidoferrales bacterium]|nr:DUF2934 domain-containing protein [Candidatus Acidoferrales bacterium]